MSSEGGPAGERPAVAIVGRPNVGKSTLTNRLVGRRDAIVQQLPGVTRDRTEHPVEWAGRAFTVIDTGGWTAAAAREDGLARAVAEQARLATQLADLIVFVVDVTTGVTTEDAEVAGWLRRGGVPVVLVANKADRGGLEAELADLYTLGLGEGEPVSALHGRGAGDLLDVIVARLAETGAFERAAQAPPEAPGIALIGRPNVGKSSLFNRLVGTERAVVDERAGTTRDAIDTLVRSAQGTLYRFVDTAGLRRKVANRDETEYYASVRTVRALDRAAVALLVIDAGQPVGEQEQRLARQILDAGRGLVAVYNKWDLVDIDRRSDLERELDRLLSFIAFAPVVRTSATTGRGAQRLFPAIDTAYASWQQRVPTARLNEWLAEATAHTAPPLYAGRPVRLRYITQVATAPPRFRLFATGQLSPGYLRYLERRLREAFGFTGAPLDIAVRVRPSWQERVSTR